MTGTSRAALELAAELGGLPLALEQAAAYIQATGDSLAGYLAEFRRRRADLLARGEPAGYPGRWRPRGRWRSPSWSSPAPGAAGLLRLLAFCAPEAVPLGLLLRSRPGLTGAAPGRWHRCWGRCWTMSWRPRMRWRRCAGIRWSARPGTGRCRCTGWCRRSPPTRCPRSCAQAWRQAAAALVEAAIPDDPRQPDTWPVFAVLLPHAQAVLACRQRRHEADRVLPRLAAATRLPASSAADADRTGPGPRPRAPEHPDRPRQPRLLDRGGGGCGRGPRPVRRAAAHPRAGARPRAPGHPDRPRQPRRAGPGGRGMRPGPATSTPRCCPSASGCSARSTRTP